MHSRLVDAQNRGIDPPEQDRHQRPDHKLTEKRQRGEPDVTRQPPEAGNAHADNHHAQNAVCAAQVVEQRHEDVRNAHPRQVQGHGRQESVHRRQLEHPPKRIPDAVSAPGRQVEAHRVLEQGGAQHAHDIKPQPFFSEQQQRYRHPEVPGITGTHAQGNDVGTAIGQDSPRQLQLNNAQ